MKDNVQAMREDFLNCTRSVDTERVEIVTDAYFKYIDRPPIVQRALTFRDILSRMTIVIREGEIIVGNQGLLKRSVPLFPEYGYRWILEQMDDFETRPGDKFKITEEQKKILRECLTKWVGYSMDDKAAAITPEPLKDLLEFGVVKNTNYKMSAPGHMSPDYGRLLEQGLFAVIEECRSHINEMDMAKLDFIAIEKRAFYEACIITCEAIIAFAGRYADLAEQQAQEEKDADRLHDLKKISQICRNIPGNPAKTYHEALQFVYFIQLLIQVEANGIAVCLGRLDQTLYKCYKASQENGMSREEALLLTEYFYLKINEIDKIYSNEAVRFLQGPAHGQCITLGGVDASGRECANELSVLMVEADYCVRLAQPDIAVRIMKDSQEEFMAVIVESIKRGINKLKVFGDRVVVESMKTLCTEPGDAEDYAILGCSEPVIAGKTNSWGNSGNINLAKCLELSLNDGKCMLTGQQMGPHTGDMSKASSFDEVTEAFRAQAEFFTDVIAAYDGILEYCQMTYYPLPLYSIATRDCIKNGKEFNAGGARYNTTSPLGVGAITVGDSLQAIKTLVFDEKRLSMDKLLEALRNDFNDEEPLRQMLLNRAAKFGNDSDVADAMSNYVLHVYIDELNKHKNNRSGGPFIGGLYYVTSYIPFGKVTAATPDGRKSTEPLNDGGISPSYGMDRRGPTAIAKSVSKLDNVLVLHGCVLNQKFHPSVFSGDDKYKNFTDYLRGFAELDCWECQYNVLTTETLRKAQLDREKYKGLVVRVAGYSAYFTQLEPELQEELIRRTEHLAR